MSNSRVSGRISPHISALRDTPFMTQPARSTFLPRNTADSRRIIRSSHISQMIRQAAAARLRAICDNMWALHSRQSVQLALGVPCHHPHLESNVLRSGGLEPCGHVSHRVRAVPAFRPR
jgi:hypothetical protein